MRRRKLIFLVVILALSVAGGALGPATQNARGAGYAGFGAYYRHYPWYIWANNVPNRSDRHLVLFDQTGNGNTRAALQTLTQSWNNQLFAWHGGVLWNEHAPWIAYVQDDSARNCHRPENDTGQSGWSYWVVCVGGTSHWGATSAQGPSYAHNSDLNTHPYSMLGTAVPTYSAATILSIVAHEFGHSMGLNHSCNPRDLMYGGPNGDPGLGCPTVTTAVGPGSPWWTDDDLNAVAQIYAHPVP